MLVNITGIHKLRSRLAPVLLVIGITTFPACSKEPSPAPATRAGAARIMEVRRVVRDVRSGNNTVVSDEVCKWPVAEIAMPQRPATTLPSDLVMQNIQDIYTVEYSYMSDIPVTMPAATLPAKVSLKLTKMMPYALQSRGDGKIYCVLKGGVAMFAFQAETDRAGLAKALEFTDQEVRARLFGLVNRLESGVIE